MVIALLVALLVRAPDLARLIPDVLERQAVTRVLQLIEHDGPFSYRQDGVVFQNREGRLTPHPRGYYREFTVPTPGAGNRGARRIICGRAGEAYYTRDHYRTFIRLDRGP